MFWGYDRWNANSGCGLDEATPYRLADNHCPCSYNGHGMGNLTRG